ncbi:helix-turn-helix domain-containing protein [Yeosuana sp. MJ-SS3]|uniref:Helix-turn-helix domain-containing protein n=1 Tax=Gilvirhabdus luticola TaxID=3079858 RepID=A0ABU3U4I9_9FLAO|nr:helix-turn-helix domain-containing protein [Yeosuana sp. MJ-SS3]MDU8885324.1 helix-turn-helix domain-containing protein [Yeosuana sp. MJ-SS3]
MILQSEFYLNFNELILIFGLLLSIIIAIAFAIKSSLRIANIWFTGFLLSSATVFAVKFLYSTGAIINYPHWFKLNFPAGILRPLLLYLYIFYLLNPTRKFKLKQLFHFIPFIFLVSYLFPFFIQNASYKNAVLMGEITNTTGILPSWYNGFQFLYSLLYLVLIFYCFRIYVKANPRPNRKKKVLIKWIRLIIVASIIFITTALTLRISGIHGNFNLYLYDIYSILIVLLCIRLITLPGIVGIYSNSNNKYERSGLSKIDISNSFSRINSLMSQEHLYKRKDLKLIHITEKLGIPEYQISQIINEVSGKSFRDFINMFRVEEAKRILLDSHNKYSIEGIAKESGFHSRASFYSAFKKHTQLTPTQYLELSK